MGRLLVFGDIGGHAGPFADKLTEHGIDPTAGHVPDGDLLVCVGDLVDTGPDSRGVLDIIERLLATSPGKVRILAGNHEHNLLGRYPTFIERRPLAPVDVDRVRSLWHHGWMKAACAVDIAGIEVREGGGARRMVGAGSVLITHAGLTVGLWTELGRPAFAHDAAEAINITALDIEGPVWEPGVMLTRTPNPAAGTAWASVQNELYPGWMITPRPPGFHQIHGHNSAWSFTDARRWQPHPLVAHVPQPQVHVDTERRHVRVEIHGQTIWGCDPGHGKHAARTWQPLVLALATP